MNYGQAIEAMKRGGVVIRLSRPEAGYALVAAGTPLQFFQESTAQGFRPYIPSIEDQLAEDWGIIG